MKILVIDERAGALANDYNNVPEGTKGDVERADLIISVKPDVVIVAKGDDDNVLVTTVKSEAALSLEKAQQQSAALDASRLVETPRAHSVKESLSNALSSSSASTIDAEPDETGQSFKGSW